MNHWLMKSEPAAFSIDDLARRRQEPWDGVRNYQARNHLRQMRTGDLAFFYHSNCAEPGIVGIAEVAVEAYPDPSQFDPASKYSTRAVRAMRRAGRWWKCASCASCRAPSR